MMTKIEELVGALNEEVTQAWGEYVDLHNELDAFRNKEFDEADKDKVNFLLESIQEKFGELCPAYNFIAQRHQSVVNAVNGYNEFIEIIKKAGAKLEPTEEEQSGQN
jgi:hypothetical protein